MTGSPSPILFVPYEEVYGEGFEAMMRRVPDLGKIRALVGYEPKMGLEAALRSVIDHFQKARPPQVAP